MKAQGVIGWGLSLAVLMLAGCGGGGASGDPAPAPTPTPTATTVISGVAAKGPIKTATVKVYAIRGGGEDRTAPVGQGQTDDSGNYTVDAGSYTGPVLVEVTGGSYIDEVSGATVLLKTPLRAMVSSVAAGTKTVAVTPLTELAYNKALGGGTLSVAAIDDANARLAAFFGLTDIVSTLPLAGDANEERRKYAFVLGAFSQLINDNRNSNEALEDALPRLLTQMGEELRNNGVFSSDTLTKINNAITAFTVGGNNRSGTTITPIALPTSGIVKLSTAGTSNTIGAIDVTVTVPAGLTVSADAATGEVPAGVVAISGVANVGDAKLVSARYSPAAGGSPATLRINLINATGFGLGEFVTIKFTVAAGGSFPGTASVFSLAGFSAVGLTGATLSGITAAPSFVGGEIL